MLFFNFSFDHFRETQTNNNDDVKVEITAS